MRVVFRSFIDSRQVQNATKTNRAMALNQDSCQPWLIGAQNKNYGMSRYMFTIYLDFETFKREQNVEQYRYITSSNQRL